MDKRAKNTLNGEYANKYCADAMAEMGVDEVSVRIDGELHDPRCGNVGSTFRVRCWNRTIILQSRRNGRFVATLAELPFGALRKVTQKIQHQFCKLRGVPTEKLDWIKE